LTGLLVLRNSRRKSARFSSRFKDLPRLLVLRGDEQHSPEMAEEIGAGNPEFLLREIPRQLKERGRVHQRQDRGLRLVGVQPAALDAMADEVVQITTPPGGLRPCAPRELTRRRRTRPLATTHPPVRHKPATADAAGTLRERPQMLASSSDTQEGHFWRALKSGSYHVTKEASRFIVSEWGAVGTCRPKAYRRWRRTALPRPLEPVREPGAFRLRVKV
jgi:hypothetical protein